MFYKKIKDMFSEGLEWREFADLNLGLSDAWVKRFAREERVIRSLWGLYSSIWG